MSYDTAPAPTSSVSTNHSNGLIVRRSLPLVEGKTYTKLGAYSLVSRTIKLKIVKRLANGCYTVVRTVELSHPGGGWADAVMDSFTVPEGEYFIGYWYSSGSIEYTENTVRACIFPASEPNGAFLADDSTGNCASVRAFYGVEDSDFEVAGAIRNSGSGWTVISDAEHAPRNVASVSVVNGDSTSGVVRVTFAKTAARVVTMVVGCDETFAQSAYTAGPSVGLSYADLRFALNGTPVSPNSIVNASGNFWFYGKFET